MEHGLSTHAEASEEIQPETETTQKTTNDTVILPQATSHDSDEASAIESDIAVLEEEMAALERNSRLEERKRVREDLLHRINDFKRRERERVAATQSRASKLTVNSG